MFLSPFLFLKSINKNSKIKKVRRGEGASANEEGAENYNFFKKKGQQNTES